MNAKELVRSTLRGEKRPRVPTGPLAVHYCARVAGYTIRRYTTDPAALAESVIRYYERFKPDAVWVSADTWVTAQAMGARVGAGSDDQPFGGLGEPLVKCRADLERLPSPDIATQGRYPIMLEALRRVVHVVGKDAFVVACFDQYPFSLAAALMGMNQIMLKVIDDPPFVEALMARCEEFGFAYGRAMAEVGADLLSGGDSPAGLLGPKLYEELALPAERRLVSRLRAATGKPVSLHICGKAIPILSLMKSSGADVLELDSAVEMGAACRIVGPEVGLWGNLDPVAVLAQGTPERVGQTARQVVHDVQATGHQRFVLSSGCTLAMETPAENLDALIRAS